MLTPPGHSSASLKVMEVNEDQPPLFTHIPFASTFIRSKKNYGLKRVMRGAAGTQVFVRVILPKTPLRLPVASSNEI